MSVVRFGPFQLDLETHELFKHGRRVRLQENPCQILIALLEHTGETVTRDELKHRLWPENSTVDFERGLGTAMGKLRSALGESAANPLFIETVPRRGFRFVGIVEEGTEELRRAAESRSKETTYSPETKSRESAFWVLALVAASAVLALVISVVGPSRPPLECPCVAVLPLVNMSGEPELDYLAYGLTEALVDSLSQFSSLHVISRTSVMRYKDERKSLTEIARELEVETILEGSVAPSGDRIQIAARLVDGEADRSLWSTRREAESGEILALTDEIALEIAGALGVTPTPEERNRLRFIRAENPQVSTNYLKARYLMNRMTRESVEDAIKHFEDALAVDERHAPSASGLARAYALLLQLYLNEDRDNLRSRARSAAARALTLDRHRAEAHLALGYVALRELDLDDAAVSLREALDLAPGDAEAHRLFAEYLTMQRRWDEARVELERALELDPLSFPVNMSMARLHLLNGQLREAETVCSEGRELVPESFVPALILGTVRLHQGRHEEAVRELAGAVERSGEAPVTLAALVTAQWAAGQKEKARELRTELLGLWSSGKGSAVAVAAAYVGMGENAEAFRWVERAIETDDPYLPELNHYPYLEKLRSDPRFIAKLEQLGFAQ